MKVLTRASILLPISSRSFIKISMLEDIWANDIKTCDLELELKVSKIFNL